MVLRLDGHGAIDDWQFATHGEGGRFTQLQVIIFVSIVFVGAWHFERVEGDVASIGEVLHGEEGTSLLR